jgi:hypothetical protein
METSSSDGGHHGGMMDDGFSMDHLDMTLGDLYLYGETRLLTTQGNLLSIHLSTQIKVPTAKASKNYGTGEFDFGTGLSVRSIISSYALFLDAGYLIIGDPTGITYENPVTLGVGIGKFFKNGDISVLLYLKNYTKILPDYQPPRQLSAGVYYKLNPRLLLSTSAFIGLSETSPDFSFYTGFELTL